MVRKLVFVLPTDGFLALAAPLVAQGTGPND